MHKLSGKAQAKATLHAAKYPANAVVGVFLGRASGSDVLLEDAVPLAHNWVYYTPTSQLGLELIDLYAQETNQSIVGIYYANERLGDTSLTPYATRLLKAVSAQFSNAVLTVLDADSLIKGGGFLPYVFSQGGFVESNDIEYALTEQDVAGLVKSHVHRNIFDFDDHLQDVTRDWLKNPSVL